MQTIYVCMHAWMDACAVYMQVGTDLIRPLTQAKEGSEYFVSLMDYFSKWPEADPIPRDKTLAEVVLFLYKPFLQVGLISCLQVI